MHLLMTMKIHDQIFNLYKNAIRTHYNAPRDLLQSCWDLFSTMVDHSYFISYNNERKKKTLKATKHISN